MPILPDLYCVLLRLTEVSDRLPVTPKPSASPELKILHPQPGNKEL